MPADPIPSTHWTNLYTADAFFQALARHWFGDAYEDVRGRLVQMGEVAADATPLSARADRHGPRLETHDPTGRRVDRVTYHPDYHRLEEMAYGNGIIGVKYDPTFLNKHPAHRHLVGFSLGYLFAQTEMGLYCPICMTDGVGRVLERHAPDDPIAQDTIRHLAATELDELWQGAMFLTEKQGGSDVGANAVQATERNGRWHLSGDKWFCSNVDAEAILVLARMPDHGPETGTGGLGLFLVLRHRPAGNGARIRIHRLKDKLGVRSMPTGEVTLDEVEGHLIGGAGDGFKQMAEMLNLSRLYNSVASIGAMRRATLEAIGYGNERKAFGAPLARLPLWRSVAADLMAETMGATLLTFETVRALDAADQGDEASARLVRLLTPLAKAYTGKLAVSLVSEAMETIGGNAYIEESILPRLLRDAQVLPIWEGTTNILGLDALRVMGTTDAADALSARIQTALANYTRSSDRPGYDAGLADGITGDLDRLTALSVRIANADRPDKERAARGWSEQSARALTKALLLETTALPDLADACTGAAQRLHARGPATAPFGGAYSPLLSHTEEPLLSLAAPRGD